MEKHMLSHKTAIISTSSEMIDMYQKYYNNLTIMMLSRRALNIVISNGDEKMVVIIAKCLMQLFNANGCKNYTLAVFKLSSKLVLLSPHHRMMIMSERFVNCTGGCDNNTPVHLMVEHDKRRRRIG